MSCWEFLGIEPTSDQRSLKRAYAKKLKQHKPDQDPEGFKQLRAAYEQAQYLAEVMANDALAEQEIEESASLSYVEQTNLEQPSSTAHEASETFVVEDENRINLSITDENTPLAESAEQSVDDICQKIIESINQRLESKAERVQPETIELIQELDLQSKRDVSFRVFHHLAELVMSTDPSSPKATDRHFIHIAEQLETEFHWNVDPLIEQYFSPEQINRVLPKYFEFRLAELEKQKLFNVPSDVDGADSRTKINWTTNILRRFIDWFLLFVLLALVDGSLANFLNINIFSELDRLPLKMPVVLVFLLTMIFYGILSNTFGGKGTIGERIARVALCQKNAQQPEFHQVVKHYFCYLPWIYLSITGREGIFCIIAVFFLLKRFGLRHIDRQHAFWI